MMTLTVKVLKVLLYYTFLFCSAVVLGAEIIIPLFTEVLRFPFEVAVLANLGACLFYGWFYSDLVKWLTGYSIY